MVGLLLLTHAPLGDAFKQAVAHVFHGMPEQFEAIDVIADQDTADVQNLARAAVSRLNTGAGVLILTDMMGGTPANCCNQLGEPDQVAVIAGISLPMLLRAITYRHDTLDVVAEMALAGGQYGAAKVDHRIRIAEN